MSDSWIEELEEQIRRAVDEIEDLRGERNELEKRVAELESSDSDDGGGWREERDEIRRRMESLTSELEALLDE